VRAAPLFLFALTILIVMAVPAIALAAPDGGLFNLEDCAPGTLCARREYAEAHRRAKCLSSLDCAGLRAYSEGARAVTNQRHAAVYQRSLASAGGAASSRRALAMPTLAPSATPAPEPVTMPGAAAGAAPPSSPPPPVPPPPPSPSTTPATIPSARPSALLLPKLLWDRIGAR
jgi:hypothetical protein